MVLLDERSVVSWVPAPQPDAGQTASRSRRANWSLAVVLVVLAVVGMLASVYSVRDIQGTPSLQPSNSELTEAPNKDESHPFSPDPQPSSFLLDRRAEG